MLTSGNNTITLEPGYYDSVTVSTDITNLMGTLEYHYGHKHTGSESSGGGCYGNPVSHYSSGCQHLQTALTTGEYAYTNNYGQDVYKCTTRCPAGHYGTDYGIARQWIGQPLGTCKNGAGTYYTYSLICGLEEGEEVRTSSTLDIQANESIISVVITY